MDKGKKGVNINKVTIKQFHPKKKKKERKRRRRRESANQIKSLVLKRETLISLSDFQFSDKRERETERSKRENH